MKTIGIDIGTTSICIIVLDGKTGNVLHSRTLSNDSVTEGAYSFERMQSPKKISEKIYFTVLVILPEGIRIERPPSTIQTVQKAIANSENPFIIP